MEESNYDEFGNYIGPALSDSDVVSSGLREGGWVTAAPSVPCHAHNPARQPRSDMNT